MELWKLAAAELAHAYARNEISPVEVVNACLERCAQVNPILNAVVYIDAGGALSAARASEARQQRGERCSALDGVPFTVKDNIFVRGVPATWGSKLYTHFVAPEDDLCVARLRDAGALFLGKTNTPELAMAGHTDNLVFGVTRNPWDRELTPGGSSGGAAAATTAGITPLALATDGGGSTRVPASFTGIFGLRPSTARVPRLHGFPALVHDLQVVGLMARSGADLEGFFNVVAQPDVRDPASMAFHESVERHPEPRPRVRLVTRVGEEPVDPQVRAAAKDAAAVLESIGCTVEEGNAPFDGAEIREIWATLSGAGVARVVTSHAGWEASVTPAILSLARAGIALSAADYLKALDRVADLRRRVRESWSEYDLLLTPTTAALPWRADEPQPRAIDGERPLAGSPSIFAKWVNAAALPAISLPYRLSREGLPIGVQLIAALGCDRMLLSIAKRFEQANQGVPTMAPL